MKKIEAEKIIDGVPVNPRLPKAFDFTPNEERPASHQKFWNVPFILTESLPEGIHYEVRCLDGGAWDRSTWWGGFGSLGAALECAKSGPAG